jgi:tetratricopeptide (TPR) repeat protein
MMTTKKGRRCHYNLVVVAAVATLVTACGPPGARELKQGEQYIQAGQSADAIALLKDAVRILANSPRPAQAKAWNLLGVACEESGHLDDAAKAYTVALKLDRDNAAIDYNLGCLRSQQANFPGAIDYLTTYVTLRPKDMQGYLRLGAAQYHSALEHTGTERSRLLDLARRDFDKAEAVGVSADAANALGMYELQRRPVSYESVHAAAKDFALALQRDQHYAPAILNLAIVSQQYLNQPAQALTYYRQYLAITPPPPQAKEVAKLAHELDLNQRIIITPETAPVRPPARAPAPAPGSATPPPAKVAVVPSNPPVNTPKPLPAESQQAQANIPAPTPAGNSAPPPAAAPAPTRNSAAPSTPQTSPESAPAVHTSDSVPEPVVTETTPPPKKSITQRLNPLNWFSGKSKSTGSGAKLAPEPPPVAPGTRYEYPPPVTPIPGDRAQSKRFEAEAIRARRSGDVAESIRAYKDAVAADPTFYDANYGLGLAALNAREYPTALEALHRALALQEDSAEARYAFAWALQKRGYNEDAVHELGKLLAQHPNEVRAHLLLGNIYAEKLNQPRLAREQFTLTLEMDPKNAQAESIRAWMKLNP